MCFILPNDCSILQAEISVVRRAVKLLTSYRIFDYDILIATGSQAAIKTLTGMYFTSSLDQEHLASINEMAEFANVSLKWVCGHRFNCNQLVLGEGNHPSGEGYHALLWTVPFYRLKACRDILLERAQSNWSPRFYIEELMALSGLGKVKYMIEPSQNTSKDVCVGHY
ncbi:hypothetical protein EVAR_73545_1 [Eumeta japonica]|uniref:Uncharacterized protein n=1 Tax=Eumeta variegata TaxID=151549 RepID=A0A4C1T4G7_EUMVA|nr:hypothetical protein EVAR_73545_1 [Eumeta japonica]